MGDLASMQAGTRVNAEQASKRAMWEPTRLRYGEGRGPWESKSDGFQGSHRGSGAGMYARGSQEQHGKPLVASGVPGNHRPARVEWAAGGGGEARSSGEAG